MSACLDFVLVRPALSVAGALDRLKGGVADALCRRVDAVPDQWFERAVARPYLGPALDRVVRPGAVLEALVFVAVTVPLAVAAVAWTVPYLFLVMSLNPGHGYLSVSAVLLGEVAWFAPIVAVGALLAAVAEGAMTGFTEWRLRYREAQTAHWARRHPGESYWHLDWVFTRD